MDNKRPTPAALARGVIFIALLGCTGTATGQVLTGNELPGMTVEQPAAFPGKALYGYIDGGADLYIEYGFVRVDVQKATMAGIEYSVEDFEMKTDTAAFGIFSISRSACAPEDSLGPVSYASPSQAAYARGRHFVRVTSGPAAHGSVRLAAAIMRKSPGHPFTLPPLFLSPYWQQSEAKYLAGRLGLENGSPSLVDLFDGLQNYEVWLVPASDRDAMLARAGFGTDQELKVFAGRIAAAGVSHQWSPGARTLVWLSSPPPQPELARSVDSLLSASRPSSGE